MTEEKEKLKETTPEVKEPSHAEPGTVPCVGSPVRADTAGLSPVPQAASRADSTDSEKEDAELDRLRNELASVRGQVARLEHERYLLSRGVPEEDLDYYTFKIEHMEGAESDFRKAAKEYLKAHPIRRTAVSSGADLGAGSARKPVTSNEMMNQLLRSR